MRGYIFKSFIVFIFMAEDDFTLIDFIPYLIRSVSYFISSINKKPCFAPALKLHKRA